MTEGAKQAGRRTGARSDARVRVEGPAEPPPRAEPEAEARVCSVVWCPIGIALGVLQGAAPEATMHLMKASQELLLAARAVIDARLKEAGEGSAEHLERIEIS